MTPGPELFMIWCFAEKICWPLPWSLCLLFHQTRNFGDNCKGLPHYFLCCSPLPLSSGQMQLPGVGNRVENRVQKRQLRRWVPRSGQVWPNHTISALQGSVSLRSATCHGRHVYWFQQSLKTFHQVLTGRTEPAKGSCWWSNHGPSMYGLLCRRQSYGDLLYVPAIL